MPVCTECKIHLNNIRALWLHLRIVHKIEKCHTFRCQEGKCFRLFSNWNFFRRHLVSNHISCASNSLWSSPLNDRNKNSDNDMDNNEYNIDNSKESTASDQFIECSTDISTNPNDLILRFLSKFYANHQLPRSFVQELMIDVKELFAEFLSIIKSAINKKLNHERLENNAIDEVECLLDSFLDVFSKFSTEYRRLKALKESEYLIPIQDYIIGDRIDDKIIHGVMVKEIVPVHAQFISMRVTLPKLFSLPGVFSSIKLYMSEFEKDTEILENFIQGQLWRNKVEKYFNGKFVIPLFLYFDDFEINNALGSHAGIQKLGALYYSFACFPPQVNSLLENIFMAGLFHSSDRAVFTNHKIFYKVIEEMNFLQSEGILVDTENGPQRVYFALGLLMGDNLGLNSILGFVESFNAAYYCRLCKTHKDVAQYDFAENRLRLETYVADVLLEDTNVTGIKEKSVWNEVQYFSTESNFTVDWLHDGPEGWFAFLMELILYYFVYMFLPVENRLSLNVLNSRINSFDYQLNAFSNKPPDLTLKEVQNKSLKMTGSEMSNFILIFSVLVGDLIPVNNNVWELYLLMRQIMDIVMCRKLQKGYANMLRTLVIEHLKLFKKLFPNERVKPKGHNLIHYGTVLEQSGPLINLSSIRFEGKHKDKKREASSTTSRKNITKSLCIKEQLGLAYRFMLKKGLVPCEDFGSEESLDHISSCEDFFLFSRSVPSNFNGPCLLLSWVKVCGIFYKFSTCVVMQFCEENDNLPVFGMIEKIFQNDEGEIGFVCRVMISYGFNSHFHAYEMELTTNLKFIQVKNLISPFPVIHIRMGNGCMFAIIRHKL